MVQRKDILKSVSLGALGAAVPSIQQASPASVPASGKKPNVVFIISDQHRAGLTKRFGYLGKSFIFRMLASIREGRNYVIVPSS